MVAGVLPPLHGGGVEQCWLTFLLASLAVRVATCTQEGSLIQCRLPTHPLQLLWPLSGGYPTLSTLGVLYTM